jgi:hypothetical protein
MISELSRRGSASGGWTKQGGRLAERLRAALDKTASTKI